MRFQEEKHARQYLIFLVCFAGALMFFSFSFSLLHGSEARKLLHERELTIASSLIEQGIPEPEIAGAFQNTVSTESGNSFLERMGHGRETPFWFLASVSGSVSMFMKASLGTAALLAVLLLLAGIRLLREQEKMYGTAIRVVTQFSRGDFTEHLPGNERGTIYQLFAAVDELAAALQTQTQKEQGAKEFLKNMISDISHQLKTPLAALNMYTEIIWEEPEHTETVKKFSEKSMRSLERMERLIQTLLKMTRLDAGSIVFRKQEQTVGELVAYAVENLTARAEEEGKRIVIRGDSEERILCDREWTGEAISNLIKNALDHTNFGGTIAIDWERSPVMLRMTVSDDGCGIAQEDIYHIFKRFYCGRASGRSQGIGLGLPLAKAIVEGQDGILSVSSSPGEGSAFTISFLTES